MSTSSQWVRRRRAALVLLAGLAVLVASCGGGGDDGASGSPASTGPATSSSSSTTTTGTTAAVEEGPDVELEYTGEGPTVAIVGDSLTASSRADLHDALDDRSVKIAAMRGEGLAGGPLSDAMDRPLMAEAITTYSLDPPDVLVIALGTNDAWQPDLAPEEFDAEWARMLDLFPDTCLVGVTVTEDAPAADPAYDGDEAAAINDRIRADVDVVVDWAAEGADDRFTDPTDTIHLTAEGRAHRARLIADAVTSCLGGP